MTDPHQHMSRAAPLTRLGRIIFGLLLAIAIFNNILLIWHFVIAFSLGFDNYRYYATMSRVRLFFFWCTVPIAAVITSWILVARHKKRKLLPRTIIWTTCLAIFIWMVQLGIEGACSWGVTAVPGYSGGGLCPYGAASGWSYGTSKYWQGGPGVFQAFLAPWFLLPFWLLHVALLGFGIEALRRAKSERVSQSEAKPVAQMQEPPRYVQDEEMRTECAQPVTQPVSVPVDDDDIVSRPPSYRASLETLDESHMRQTDVKPL